MIKKTNALLSDEAVVRWYSERKIGGPRPAFLWPVRGLPAEAGAKVVEVAKDFMKYFMQPE